MCEYCNLEKGLRTHKSESCATMDIYRKPFIHVPVSFVTGSGDVLRCSSPTLWTILCMHANLIYVDT